MNCFAYSWTRLTTCTNSQASLTQTKGFQMSFTSVCISMSQSQHVWAGDYRTCFTYFVRDVWVSYVLEFVCKLLNSVQVSCFTWIWFFSSTDEDEIVILCHSIDLIEVYENKKISNCRIFLCKQKLVYLFPKQETILSIKSFSIEYTIKMHSLIP